MLYKKVLPDYSYSLLEEVQSHSYFDQFYLAGGTALALQLGHRVSVDLDFFSFAPLPDNCLNELSLCNFEEFEIVYAGKNSIELIINKTKVFFWYFAYPLLNDILEIDGLRLASALDVGIMKLMALQGRDTRKDIIDLYFIHKKIIELDDLLSLFIKERDSENYLNNYKPFFHRELIEDEPMPVLLQDGDWNEMFEFVSKELRMFIQTRLLVNFVKK